MSQSKIATGWLHQATKKIGKNLFNEQRGVAISGHCDEVFVEQWRVDGVAPATLLVDNLPAVVVNCWAQIGKTALLKQAPKVLKFIQSSLINSSYITCQVF